MEIHSLYGQLLPVLYHRHGKIIFLICNQNFPFFQTTPVASHPIAACFQESGSIFSISSSPLVEPSPPKAEQTRLSQPPLNTSHAPASSASWAPSTGFADSRGYISIFLGSSKLGAILKMQSHKCWVRGNNHFLMNKFMRLSYLVSFFFSWYRNIRNICILNLHAVVGKNPTIPYSNSFLYQWIGHLFNIFTSP